ncbi:MAG: GNAT family N-acetyltransferase [Nocardioides sp.]
MDLPLPAGLTTRPLTTADAAAVTAVVAAQELADVGEVVIEEADIVADWQVPAYDVAADTRGVFTGDELVAYAASGPSGRCDAAVHPDHTGRGIGTQLAHWMQARGREQGHARIGMAVPQGSPGDRLLASLGYHVRWTSWVLQLPEGARIPERPLPEGYTVRAARIDEQQACWTVQEDAFLEWSDRERDTFEEWEASTTRRPGFEPWNLRVVTDPDDTVVAMALVQLSDLGDAYIARLATRRDHRGRGIAQALLVDAFAVAAEHGATRSELSTDSRTGALSLYEKVGMKVTSVWLHRAIELGATR